METVGDLVARERRSDDPALVAGDGRAIDYRRFCTTAWKTGNFLRRLGVREGVTVGVVGRAPEACYAFVGTALLGARTWFDPAENLLSDDVRALVAPGDRVADFDLPPGGQRVAYGEPPDDPHVAGFGESVWSENPAFPATPVSPERAALTDGERDYGHADLLDAGRSIADEWALEPGDEVAVLAPLSDPRTVAAGVVAPLLAGATVVLSDEEAAGDVGDFAVVEDGGPEGDVVAVDAVSL